MDNVIRPGQPNQPSANPTPPSPQPTEQQPPAPTPTPEPEKRKFAKKPILIILAVILIIGGGIFALTQANKKTQAPPEVVKNEIPLITYGTADGAVGSIYPSMPLFTTNTEINSQIFEGLVQFENGTKITPLLAASWTNPDDTTWVFNLKQNVKFHSGRPMTAKDVKFSLEGFKDNKVWNDGTGNIFGSTIKKVDVVNDYQVKITTHGPDPILLNRLVFLYIIDSQSKEKDSPVNGTGAYTIKPDTKPTDTKTELVAFDGYHGGRPLTRALVFRFYEDDKDKSGEEKLTEARLKGQVSIAGDVFDQANVDKLKVDSANLPIQDIGLYNLSPNVNKAGSPLAKLKVREAVYHAIDADALIKARNVSGQPANQLVTQDIPGYNPLIKRPETDAEHAKMLLKEAGYPNGVTITLSYFNGAQDAADELVKQLAKAGITLKLDGYDDTDILGEKILNGDLAMDFNHYATDTLDAMQVFVDNFQTAKYNNPTINKVIAKANTTLDSAKRLELLQTISKMLMDDVAWIPLYSYTTYWLYDPSYVITQDLPGTTIGAYYWKVYAK